MKSNEVYRPSIMEITAELDRVKRRMRRKSRVRIFVLALILALCVGAFFAPRHISVFSVNGNSMEYTLQSGDYVICLKNTDVKRGDIIAFEREGALLIKRVIGVGGDSVRVGYDGKVYLNGRVLEETYIASASLGTSDVTYPVVVPEGELFVMGDHRSTSLDSRNSRIGTVKVSEVVGCVKGVLWPAYRIQIIDG